MLGLWLLLTCCLIGCLLFLGWLFGLVIVVLLLLWFVDCSLFLVVFDCCFWLYLCMLMICLLLIIVLCDLIFLWYFDIKLFGCLFSYCLFSCCFVRALYFSCLGIWLNLVFGVVNVCLVFVDRFVFGLLGDFCLALG